MHRARARSRRCRSAEAFDAVAEWSQTVLRPENATELAALAMKHAIVQRDVAHLIFPDEVQELPGRRRRRRRGHAPGRVAATGIAPPEDELGPRRRAARARRAAGDHRAATAPAATATRSLALAEHLDAPVITTFKAKGLVPDDHPLGVRRARPLRHPGGVDPRWAAATACSCSARRSRTTRHRHLRADDPGRPRPDDARQVPPRRRAAVGRHRPHARAARRPRCPPRDRPEQRDVGRHAVGAVAGREGARGATLVDGTGRMHPALVFARAERASCPRTR